MNTEVSEVGVAPSVIYRYPLSHWSKLHAFIDGNTRDFKDVFDLAADTWDVAVYADQGHASRPYLYRLHFGHLRSFLKPYVKYFCYQRILGRGKAIPADAGFPYFFKSADAYLIEHHFTSLDDLAPPAVFEALWQTLLPPRENKKELRPAKDVECQIKTRTFWIHLRGHFGIPHTVPKVAPHKRRYTANTAADVSKLVPLPVLRQLVNKLALHRDEKEVLAPFDHLRLCVLILTLCTGRRINEILSAPRRSGPDGPLSRYPARGGPPDGALWFHYAPNKHGSQDRVYISQEWEEIIQYTVHALIHYSDEVRASASPAEKGLLILVSRSNRTAGYRIAESSSIEHSARTELSWEQPQHNPLNSRAEENSRREPFQTTGITAQSLWRWLNGNRTGSMRRWKITVDGSANGEIYHLRTHQFRHSRQSALASDPQVSLQALQRDLNLHDPDLQIAYQHNLQQQQDLLRDKARQGLFCGPGMNWLAEVLGTSYQGPERRSEFREGLPSMMSPRWRKLIINNPQFVEINRVPCGYCALPQGPQCCDEFLNCTETRNEGCRWFLTDPHDPVIQLELTERAANHRRKQQESLAAGRIVQAGKYEVMAQRTEAIQADALQHSSEELRTRMEARKKELEGSSHEEAATKFP